MTTTKPFNPGLAPGESAPDCQHGPRVRGAGFSVKSKRYFAGHYCPEAARDCAPLWVDISTVIKAALDAWKAGGEGPTDEVADDAEPPF